MVFYNHNQIYLIIDLFIDNKEIKRILLFYNWNQIKILFFFFLDKAIWFIN